MISLEGLLEPNNPELLAPSIPEIDIPPELGGRCGSPVVNELNGGRSMPVYDPWCRWDGGLGGGSILSGFWVFS
jgi:hypothetical protein